MKADSNDWEVLFIVKTSGYHVQIHFFNQNLFHLKFFIDVNLKHFVGTPKFSGTNGPVLQYIFHL